MKKRIKKVLIANRGEITLRIAATAANLGIKTVAIYTQEDQFLSFVHTTNESYQLKQNGIDGYLNQENIIGIAKSSGADSIHPGYGFLSENSEFARRVIDAGLTWIGPDPRHIVVLGDKNKARIIAARTGIRTIPSVTHNTSDAFCKIEKTANSIGFPIILKCAHGGGGKAMRIVDDKNVLKKAWEAVCSEAKRIFSSNTILLEKKIESPRHIEVQIAGDGENQIHLYERECSIQRNNQKIIEESPCDFISKKTREKLYEAAIRMAEQIKYKNVGTVEFLLTQNEQIYFLEVNTRLQVEHSVTELTTNVDLVAMQFQIAETNNLPFRQDEIEMRGHAIECRIYAENPTKNFQPSTGRITNLVLPKSPFLRIDHDLEEGQDITPNFDSMIVKLTVFGRTRKEAIARMRHTLSKTNISGIETNVEFLQKIFSTKSYADGQFSTQFLNKQKREFFAVREHKEPFSLGVEDAKKLAQLPSIQFYFASKTLCKITSPFAKPPSPRLRGPGASEDRRDERGEARCAFEANGREAARPEGPKHHRCEGRLEGCPSESKMRVGHGRKKSRTSRWKEQRWR